MFVYCLFIVYVALAISMVHFAVSIHVLPQSVVLLPPYWLLLAVLAQSLVTVTYNSYTDQVTGVSGILTPKMGHSYPFVI